MGIRGGGWNIGKVCINPPNNLAVDILINLSPLPFPTLPLNPEDRSGAFMSGEVGECGRKKQETTQGLQSWTVPWPALLVQDCLQEKEKEARERDKSLASDCTDLFLVGREAVDLQDLPASGMK